MRRVAGVVIVPGPRAHPPHAVGEALPADLWLALTQPEARSVDASSATMMLWPAPWLVGVGSMLVCMVLYALSSCCHAHYTDDIFNALRMAQAERRMKRRDAATARQRGGMSHSEEHGASVEDENTDDDEADLLDQGVDDSSSSRSADGGASPCRVDGALYHRKPSAAAAAHSMASVRILSAAHVAPASAPRSPLQAYFYAYAACAQRSLTSRIEWNSRVVSTVHALVSCVLGVCCLLFDSSPRTDSAVLSSVGITQLPFSGPDSPFPPPRSGPELYWPLSSAFTPSLMAFNEDLLRDYALMITSGYLAYDLLLCIAVRITFAGVTDPFWRPKTQRQHKMKAKPLALTQQQLQQQQQPAASEASEAASASPSPSTTPPAPSASPLLPPVCGVSSPRAPADGIDPSADDENASSSSSSAVARAPPPVRIDDALTLLHHVLIIGAFSGGVALHIGTFFMSCFLLNEASTLPLNLNWLLACMRAAGLWGGGREATASRISVDGAEQPRNPRPLLSLSARFYAALYKANGVVLLVLFLLLRVLFNVCVLAAMVLTWWSLRPLWLGRSSSSSSDSSSTTGNGGVGESEPAPMTSLHISQCAALSALAAGHVLINVLWAAALVKAVRRKLCGKGSTPAHKSKKSKAA